MLADALTQRLRERFPDMKTVFGDPPEAVVVIPAAHSDVGDIQIFVRGCEIIFMVGGTTCFLGDFDFAPMQQGEREQLIVDHVTHFLERLFADQIVLWRSQRSLGGWYDRQRVGPVIAEFQRVTKGKKLYVWSGPTDR